MTVQETILSRLTSNGLSDSQANTILDLAKVELKIVCESYTITWNRPVNEYPLSVINVLYSFIKKIAHEWLLANKPQAWFLPMFE